jgi:hypothetical protein
VTEGDPNTRNWHRVRIAMSCRFHSTHRPHPKTSEVCTIPLHIDDDLEDILPWKCHGGARCPIDGVIYAIPQSAPKVLAFDPITEQVSFVGQNLRGKYKYKWYGGLIGKQDGAIYGMPQNASGVLRIHPTEGVTVVGGLPRDGFKWHGGAVAVAVAENGVTVAILACVDSVLLVHPATPPKMEVIGDASVVQTGRHLSDRRYKFLGAMVHGNNVYCIPSGSEHVLEVDTVNKTVEQVGPDIADHALEPMRQNKWQNGFTVGNGMYAIPSMPPLFSR